jgi:hypothetical protein
VLYLAVQDRQVCVDRLSYDFVVDLEVTMRDGVAHLVGERQGQFGMPRCKLRMMLLDVVTGFAENFQVADDGVLYEFVMQERELVYILGMRLILSIASSMCAR